MNWKNAMLIMKKDWKVNLRNKQIAIPMIILPIIFTVLMPILMLIGILYAPEEFLAALGGKEYLVSTINTNKNFNTYLLAADISAKILVLPYFLFVPSLITIILSADSFAGEKERKTIESLALLTISKMELLIGKVLTAFIPALCLSFIFFGIQGIIINVMFYAWLEGHILVFLDPVWLTTIFFLTPAIAFLNVLIGTIISSRSKDFKSAQSISGSLIVPVIGIMFIQMVNPAFLSPVMISFISGIIGILILFFVYLGNKLLDIEKLLIMS